MKPKHPDMVVRAATKGDRERIRRWRRQMVSETGQVGKAKSIDQHLIVEREGVPVGMIGVSSKPRGILYHVEDGSRENWHVPLGKARGHVIGDFFVEEGHRRSPAARHLLRSVIKEARERRLETLLTMPGNDKVHKLLERLDEWERLGPSTTGKLMNDLPAVGIDTRQFPKLAPLYRMRLK